jgi:hypothetical protein
MATHAKLTSIDALERFRASLIVFVNKTQSALNGESDQIRRMRSWIQTDRRAHWESELRRRARALAQAEQELLSARMTKAANHLTLQQMAVHRARHALEEAQEKMRMIKNWIRDFDGEVEPLAKGMNTLRAHLDHEMPQAIAYLSELQKIVEGYTEVKKPAAAKAGTPTEES